MTTIRTILVLLAAVVVASPAHAKTGNCIRGSDKVLRLADWSAKAEKGAIRVTFHVEATGTKPIRMVKGSVSFRDVLGSLIGGVSLTPDLHIVPGGPASDSQRISSLGRLVEADHADVVATLCTDGVVYADGTKETFP